jgi:cytochrome c-type biogenesis protein CcmH/NrfF
VRRTALLIALALLVAGPTAGAIAAACPKTSLAEIEHEVMCPVCGVPLSLATEAPQAQRERAFIQREVASCKSKSQIKAELRAQFGDRVLALPPSKGFDVAAYVVPVAVVLAGLAAIALLFLRKRRRGVQTDAAATRPPLAGEDAARLEADLQRYDT